MAEGNQQRAKPNRGADSLLAHYRPIPGTVDEMVDATGAPRPVWASFIQALERLGPDVLARFTLPSLRMMVHMAAPCAPWLKQAWIDWLGSDRVWEYYGTTEGTGSTIISGTDWLAHRGSVGRVREGYEMRILDVVGCELPPGELTPQASGVRYRRRDIICCRSDSRQDRFPTRRNQSSRSM